MKPHIASCLLILLCNLQTILASAAGDVCESTAASTGNTPTESLIQLQTLADRLAYVEELVGKPTTPGKEDGSRIPTKLGDDNKLHDLSLFERMRYLEHKEDGTNNWLKDPQLYEHTQTTCNNLTNLETDHYICLDNWEMSLARRQRSGKPEKCVVYDLGIRANPEFGKNLMQRMGCSVRAYDPSPTSQKWWSNKEGADYVKELKAAGENMYKFQPVGAGGVDGDVELFDYNWQQVSIYKAENDITLKPKGTADIPPKVFKLPVKTLRTMMLDNDDSYIDILKLDIEGSEYLFLQDAFDRMGCPPVGQIAVEWHHFSIDDRYGSSEDINVLHNLLNSCGYKAFMTRDHWKADPEWNQGGDGGRKIPPVRYTLAAYCKDCLL